MGEDRAAYRRGGGMYCQCISRNPLKPFRPLNLLKLEKNLVMFSSFLSFCSRVGGRGVTVLLFKEGVQIGFARNEVARIFCLWPTGGAKNFFRLRMWWGGQKCIEKFVLFGLRLSGWGGGGGAGWKVIAYEICSDSLEILMCCKRIDLRHFKEIQ